MNEGIKIESTANFKIPITSLFLRFKKGYPIQEPKIEFLLPYTLVASFFSCLSALFHFSILIFFDTYIRDLRKGINRFRWYDYALSSSLMIALLALLFGMYDIISLILLMSLNACMNLFGLLMEILNQNKIKKDWTPFYFGCFAGVFSWLSVYLYLINMADSKNTPYFAWAILITYTIMFQTFPINMILQKKGINRWGDKFWGYRMSGYYYGEIVYQVLSIIAKSILIWLIFAGSQANPRYD